MSFRTAACARVHPGLAPKWHTQPKQVALGLTPWPRRTYAVYLDHYCFLNAHSCQSPELQWRWVEEQWPAVSSHAGIFRMTEQVGRQTMTLYHTVCVYKS